MSDRDPIDLTTLNSGYRQYYLPPPCPREHFYRLADAGNLPADLWWLLHREAQRAAEFRRREKALERG